MGRGRAPCCDKNNVKKGPWSPAEDLRLTAFIQKHGHGNWRSLPKQAGLSRCGKSCRLRWINYLSPNVKRGNFTLEEEEVILKLHDSYGNKWSKIAAELPGRTDNEIKNVWNTHLKKRLIQKDSKCHKDEKSKEASIISPSSSSSSATSNVSCGEQNMRNGIHDQDFVAKIPEISTQICPDIKPKEASRSTSFSSNVSNASNFWGSSQVDITRPNEEMDSLFNSEGLGEVHNAANVGPLDHLEDINHGFVLDSEFDLWNVLENLESFEAPPEQSSKVGLKYDIKQSEWYRYLENYEFGITGEEDQSNPQKKAGQTEIDGLTFQPEIDPGMSTCFPLWPPSPHNFDI